MSEINIVVVRTQTLMKQFDNRIAAEQWVVKQAGKDENDRKKGERVDYEIWTSPHPASE